LDQDELQIDIKVDMPEELELIEDEDRWEMSVPARPDKDYTFLEQFVGKELPSLDDHPELSDFVGAIYGNIVGDCYVVELQREGVKDSVGKSCTSSIPKTQP